MNLPPTHIDGALVLEWAVPDHESFFEMPVAGARGIPIVGLAICRYERSGAVYRFSCSEGWETENDAPFSTIEAARNGTLNGIDLTSVRWRPR